MLVTVVVDGWCWWPILYIEKVTNVRKNTDILKLSLSYRCHQHNCSQITFKNIAGKTLVTIGLVLKKNYDSYNDIIMTKITFLKHFKVRKYGFWDDNLITNEIYAFWM